MRWLLFPLYWLDTHTRVGQWDTEWVATVFERFIPKRFR